MIPSLPSGLPSIRNAKLPAVYEQAKEALATCTRIDECAEWANKAEALASYAKQAEDDSLRKQADRIQARAIRRCGELLKDIKRAQGARTDREPRGGAPPKLTRAQAAKDAGLSRDQKRTALRVASVPASEFERAVESEDPPTVTDLARRGTAKPLVDLKGRDPEEFKLSTEAIGHLRRLFEFTERADPVVVIRGAFPKERKELLRQAGRLTAWLNALERAAEAEG